MKEILAKRWTGLRASHRCDGKKRKCRKIDDCIIRKYNVLCFDKLCPDGNCSNRLFKLESSVPKVHKVNDGKLFAVSSMSRLVNLDIGHS